MPCKLVLYFNQFASGFSETYYHPSTNPITLADSLSNAFYQAAAAPRSVDTILVAARFSDTLPPRASTLVRPYPVAQGTRSGTLDVGPDVVSTDAVWLLTSSLGATRRLFMRGLADQDVRRDIFGNDLPSATLRTLTYAWLQALFAAGFSIRTSQRPPNAGLVWSPVIRVARDPESSARSSYFISTSATQLFTRGQSVQFNGVPKSLPRFPRKAVITNAVRVDDVWWYFLQYGLPGGVFVDPPTMRVTPSSYAYSVISRWAFERFSEHKTGRPFGSLRGRARGA